MNAGHKNLFACAGLLIALNATAHDPALHAAEKEKSKAKPNCEAVSQNSAVSPSDPVALAIQKKCAQESKQPATTHESAPSPKAESKAETEHGGH